MANSNVARTTLVCSWLFTILATASIITQALRIRKKRAAELDDYLLFVAFAISLLLVAQTTWAVVDEGQGVPDVELMNESHDHFSVVAKSLFANEILWGFVNTLLRVSALLLCRKLLGVTVKMRVLTTVAIFVSAAFGIVILLTSLLICRPVSAAWDPFSSCNEVPSYVALEAIGLGLDFGIVALPIAPIWSLQLPIKQKLQVLLALSVGGLVVVVTALRLKALHLVASTDVPYDKGYLSLLSNVGALIGIIGCSGPAISAFFMGYEGGFVQRTATRLGSIYFRTASMLGSRVPKPSSQNGVSIIASAGTSLSRLLPTEIYPAGLTDERISSLTGIQHTHSPSAESVHSVEPIAGLGHSHYNEMDARQEKDITEYVEEKNAIGFQ